MNEEARKEALDAGISPLDYLLSVMRDEDQKPYTRMDAAKAAAPYVHAKLASTELTGKDGKDLVPPHIEIINAG